jgi:hypothetical protein
LGDVLILLEEKKEELREVEACRTKTLGAIAMSERRNRASDDEARVEDLFEWHGLCHGVGREERQGSKCQLEGLIGETERVVSGGGEEGEKERCLVAAHALRSLQQAVSEEEDRLQNLQSLGEDRARSLKRTCVQSPSSIQTI